MSYSAFHFVECGTGTTHIFAWDPARGRWVMPCGLYSKGNPASFRGRLCRTCDNRTRQVREKVPR